MSADSIRAVLLKDYKLNPRQMALGRPASLCQHINMKQVGGIFALPPQPQKATSGFGKGLVKRRLGRASARSQETAGAGLASPLRPNSSPLWVRFFTVGVALLVQTAEASCPNDGEPPGVRKAPGWELFAGTNVPGFSLEIDSAGLRTLRQAPREWVHATLRLGEQTFTNVGVHIKGSEGSLQPIDRRPSLTVSVNKYVPGRKLFGLHKIHFNNTAEDPTFMTEVLCGELCRQAGLPAARSGHGTLKINDRALGLYVVKEGLTKSFLAQYFKQTDGALYDSGFRQDITTPLDLIGGIGPEDQSDRLELLAAAREPDIARRWMRLQKTLDTERFISLLAMTTLTWNWDGYPMAYNNYRVYHNPEDNRMVFIPHGLDQMFWAPQGTIYPRWRGLVAKAVAQVPEGRHLYRERLGTLLTNVFQVTRLHRRIDELAALITPYRPETVTQAARLKNLISARARSVEAQLQMSEPVSPSFINNTAALTGWSHSFSEPVSRIAVLDMEGAARALRFLHKEPASSTSTVRLWLPAGHYEFQGRVRVVQISASEQDRQAGVGLRAMTALGTSSRRLLTSSQWQELRCPFDSRSSDELVELGCDVRNAVGEVWFDLGSLQIRRVTPESR